ncbi:MAG TPA: GIDE domain-containing protein [Candidatus Sulfotelmatobacter sp.]|nr:GIDE domain-containing protein [Candidatus Sulfotelmatobacter sp.]
MHAGAFPFYAAVALGGGPIWFLHGFQSLRKKRLIENTPTARIRSMAMGLVEVQGTVVARSALAAPFSGRSCVHWELDISTRSGRQGWNVVHRASSGQPFFIRDQTGVALVYPQGVESHMNFGVEEDCSGPVFPACYEQYMKEHCGMKSNLWRLGTVRFRERILEDSQAVFLMGTATPRSRALDISGGDELMATGTDGAPVQRPHTIDDDVKAIIRQGQEEKTFILSQQSAKMVEWELGFHALAGVLGGPTVTLIGLAFLLDLMRHGHWKP